MSLFDTKCVGFKTLVLSLLQMLQVVLLYFFVMNLWIHIFPVLTTNYSDLTVLEKSLIDKQNINKKAKKIKNPPTIP